MCPEKFILYIVQISAIPGLDCETRKTVECTFPGIEEISHSLDSCFFPIVTCCETVNKAGQAKPVLAYPEPV